MLRSGTFSKFGTLPAIMATCQHWETFLDEAPCPPTTFDYYGQDAKNSWHAAKSTPHDPPWSWPDHYLTFVPKIGQEKAVYCGFLTLTFNLDLPKIGIRSKMSIYIQKNQVCRSIGGSRRGGYGWTENPILTKSEASVLFSEFYRSCHPLSTQCGRCQKSISDSHITMTSSNRIIKIQSAQCFIICCPCVSITSVIKYVHVYYCDTLYSCLFVLNHVYSKFF